MERNICSRIRNRSATVIVFGLGYVGLPTATLIANAGFKVVGVDSNPLTVESILRANLSREHSELGDMLKKPLANGHLRVTSKGNNVTKKADIVVVCVQTPVGRNKKPDLSWLEKVCRNISQESVKGKLVIIESTLPPGTTRDFVLPILQENSKLKCGRDFWLCHCPERVMPGEPITNLAFARRVVGGLDEESGRIATEFYKTFVNAEIDTTTSTVAELAKTAENTFRDVNIAFANELALISEMVGADVTEVIKIANTHPRVNVHQPGPGVGGPCLPKDPYLLLYPAECRGFRSRVIRASRTTNDSMPQHVVELVSKGFSNAHKEMKKAHIAVLGTSYKANVSDSRLTPAKKIIHKLMKLDANVKVFDPHCRASFGAETVDSVEEAATGADCILIVTDHIEFKKLNLKEIAGRMNPRPFVVDAKRVFERTQAERSGLKYYGVGLG
jgi:UDP-N-acetyl-D-mannosaminuronic acid dehydrogenase